MSDAVGMFLQKLDAFVQGFFWIAPDLALALVVFLAFLGGSWAAKRAIIRLGRRSGRPDLGSLLGGFARWAITLFGVLVVATIVFPSVKPADVLATLGIGSVAIGFAFKDILQNWLSGVLILYRQPFRRGDQIVSGPFEGTVESVEPRATLIRTYDGQRVVIPNAEIYTRAVTVRTAFRSRRSEYDVGIGYGDDVERACVIVMDALRKVDGIERDPAPEVIPWALEGSSVNIRVRWWSDPHIANVVRTHGRVIGAIRNALHEAGVDLPFPTRVVLFHDQTEEADRSRVTQREGWPVDLEASGPGRPDRNSVEPHGDVSGCSAEPARRISRPSGDRSPKRS